MQAYELYAKFKPAYMAALKRAKLSDLTGANEPAALAVREQVIVKLAAKYSLPESFVRSTLSI